MGKIIDTMKSIVDGIGEVADTVEVAAKTLPHQEFRIEIEKLKARVKTLEDHTSRILGHLMI